MRISLYLDEDSHSSSLIHALRYGGLDVTTAREAQMLGSTDLEQLYWATAHGRVFYFNIRAVRSAEEMIDQVEFLSGWDEEKPSRLSSFEAS